MQARMPQKRRMNWRNINHIVSTGLLFCWLGAFIVMGSVEAKFRDSPQVEDPLTGHTIPLTLKGTGTVYLTDSEWSDFAPYEYADYLILVALLVSAATPAAVEGYQGFVRKWQREKKQND